MRGAAERAPPPGRWLKVGSVIGYLAADVLIGPCGLGFVYEVSQVDAVLRFAEFDVVLLLFLIGRRLPVHRYINTAFVLHSECVPKFAGWSPMLAIHP